MPRQKEFNQWIWPSLVLDLLRVRGKLDVRVLAGARTRQIVIEYRIGIMVFFRDAQEFGGISEMARGEPFHRDRAHQWVRGTFEFKDLDKVDDGAGAISGRDMREAATRIGLHTLRIEPDCFIEVGERQDKLALVAPDVAAVRVSDSAFWSKRD